MTSLRSQWWTVKFYDEDGELTATARVRAYGPGGACTQLAEGDQGAEWTYTPPGPDVAPDPLAPREAPR